MALVCLEGAPGHTYQQPPLPIAYRLPAERSETCGIVGRHLASFPWTAIGQG